MAKKSMRARQQKREALCAKVSAKRAALRATRQDQNASDEQRADAQIALQNLKRNANPTRLNNRCGVCARPRSYLRRFGICRLCLRKYGMKGLIPGLVKSSW